MFHFPGIFRECSTWSQDFKEYVWKKKKKNMSDSFMAEHIEKKKKFVQFLDDSNIKNTGYCTLFHQTSKQETNALH